MCENYMQTRQTRNEGKKQEREMGEGDEKKSFATKFSPPSAEELKRHQFVTYTTASACTHMHIKQTDG